MTETAAANMAKASEARDFAALLVKHAERCEMKLMFRLLSRTHKKDTP